MEPLIDIVLPCLDEAEALPWVLRRIPSVARAIVVDNGSSDGSPQLATAHGADVVTCTRRGYGAACQAGLAAARAEFVAFCDCDASLDPADALRLVGALRGGADLAVCRRRPSGRRAWPLHVRLANRELARRVRRRTGAPVSDIGPLRVARRTDLVALGVTDPRYGYPVETVVRAAAAGWRIAQVDVAYTPRQGRSKVSGTVRGTILAVRDTTAVLGR